MQSHPSSKSGLIQFFCGANGAVFLSHEWWMMVIIEVWKKMEAMEWEEKMMYIRA